MLQHLMNCVKAFHEKMDVARACDLPVLSSKGMVEAAQAVLDIAADMEDNIQDDPRWLRMHLILEEVGEACMAMANGQEIELLDGLADTLYVLLGTAVMFDLPLGNAFAEVHSSNMTKTRKSDDPGRVRDKGKDFKPPNLEEVLRVHRLRNPIQELHNTAKEPSTDADI